MYSTLQACDANLAQDSRCAEEKGSAGEEDGQLVLPVKLINIHMHAVHTYIYIDIIGYIIYMFFN